MLKNAIYWSTASTIALLAAFLYFPKSLMSDMVVVIWLLAGIIIIYLARKEKEAGKKNHVNYPIAAAGLLICLFSFINQILEVFGAGYVFWNPPYSISEFAVFLSGLSVAFYGLRGYKKLVLPAGFPALVFAAYQFFEIFRENIDTIAAPLLDPTTRLSVWVLGLLGIPALIHPEYVISFMTVEGIDMKIQIVIDCTGIWSLGAFTASLILVWLGFPKVFSKKSIPYLAIGYIGTYTANILRVVAICVSAYLYGNSGNTMAVHMHAGWIAFSGWMLIFWYVFFSRRLLKDAAVSRKR